MLHGHCSKRLKVLQGPRMAFENLQAFRGGFAGWETLKCFQLGAMGNLETFELFATKAERHKGTRRKKRSSGFGSLSQRKVLLAAASLFPD